MTVRSLVQGVALCLAVVVSLGVVVLLLVASPKAGEAEKSFANFDNEGNLRRPDGWRDWVYVGTPITPNDLNPPAAAFPEFHNVYIDPESYAHYQKTGTFRQGTILVKELVSVGSKQASSGKGYFMGEFIGLEATVKSAQQFPKEPGNWGYFTFSHAPPPYPATAQLKPTAECNTACHQALAADDWVFTQYYPVLRAVKPK
jgi:hypothetical protein